MKRAKKYRPLMVGNNELVEMPSLGPRKTITCEMCDKRHKVFYGEQILKDGAKEPTKTLSFYKCKDKTYLVGIRGKDIRQLNKGNKKNGSNKT